MGKKCTALERQRVMVRRDVTAARIVGREPEWELVEIHRFYLRRRWNPIFRIGAELACHLLGLEPPKPENVH